jgi:hypothetical protein
MSSPVAAVAHRNALKYTSLWISLVRPNAPVNGRISMKANGIWTAGRRTRSSFRSSMSSRLIRCFSSSCMS